MTLYPDTAVFLIQLQYREEEYSCVVVTSARDAACRPGRGATRGRDRMPGDLLRRKLRHLDEPGDLLCRERGVRKSVPHRYIFER